MEEFFAKIPELLGGDIYGMAKTGIIALLTLVIGFMVIKWVMNLVRKALQTKGVDKDLRPFLASIMDTGLKIALIITVVGMFGADTTSFVAILGAMSFAVGLALQGSLGHFASGVLILLFKPYRTGDLVDIQGNVGFVEEIQIFNTVLLTLDNKKIIIPNGNITNGAIMNISGQGEIKVVMSYGIGYGDDIDKARATIQRVADECPHVLHDKPVDIFVEALGDSSVNFAVKPWAKSEHYWDVYYYMHENVKKAFDKDNIGIPYPTMDLNITKQN
jgi:small conductance mechanosensitive channel